MKILHCCLAAFYIDNYGYQENILPKIHQIHGHEVKIVASTETFIDDKNLGYVKPASYINSDNIPVTRLSYQKWLPHFIMKKLRLYNGFIEQIELFKPDVFFLHDCQFLSIFTIIRYLKKHRNVKVFVDCHTDIVNSGTNWLSMNVLHKIIYRFCAKSIEKYTTAFYGTLPARNDFLINIYGVSHVKVKLLPMGIDDTLFNWEKKDEIRKQVRSVLGLTDSDFVIISGGKIDFRKNIHVLIDVFTNHINQDGLLNVKLILFGKPTETELNQKILDSCSSNFNIVFIEWLPSNEIYKYFFASDLGVFLGTHSVLWEEAVGSGLPCVFQKWDGIQHIDVGGNCVFVNNGNDLTIVSDTLNEIINNQQYYNALKENAEKKGPANFSYKKIAIQSLLD